MRVLLLLVLFLAPVTVRGQQMFRPFILGSGQPSSPRYGYRTYNRYQVRSRYRAPARYYRAPYYSSPMRDLNQMRMADDISDIADSLRSRSYSLRIKGY